MSEAGELYGSTAVKAAVQQVDSYLASKGVAAETRDAITNSFEIMYEYIPYAIKQGKDPTDGKILAEFLRTKGLKTLKFTGEDNIKCGVAIVEFLLSAHKAAGSTATGVPPVMTLAYGLALLDLIEVGNSCEFAQQAYYEAFLRESSVKLEPVRMRVENTYQSLP